MVDLSKSSMAATVSRRGFNPHFPHAVVHGPSKYGGLAIAHILYEFHTKKITYVFVHLFSNNTVGKLLHIALQWYQVHIGVSWSMFTNPQPYPHGPGTWVNSFRQSCAIMQVKLYVRDLTVDTPVRVNDRTFMDVALETGFFSFRNQDNQCFSITCSGSIAPRLCSRIGRV